MNPDEYRRMFEQEETLWWYVGLHELILDVVGSEAGAGRTLRIFDAGCGTGRLARLMSRYGEVQGCDASALAIACCRRRGLAAVTLGDLRDAPLHPGDYDVVTCIDVLYHRGIDDDTAIMRRLFDALRPGGLLVVQVPAFEALRSTHDTAVWSRERYRKGTLVARLSRAGFTVSFASYRVFLLFPLAAVHRFARRLLNRPGQEPLPSDVRPLPPAVNRLLLGVTRLENRLLERRVPLPFGLSLFALARRPGTAAP